MEECLERYFKQISVEPQPSNVPPKQTPIRKFFELEATDFLCYDEEDDKKFVAQTGFCLIDLVEYMERFNKELHLLMPYYFNYNGYTNRDSYKPLLLSLSRKIDFEVLRRLRNW